MKAKQDLLAELTRLGACSTARDWVAARSSDDAETVWRSCENISWLIWFAGRRNKDAIAAFARRCANRAVAYCTDSAYAYDTFGNYSSRVEYAAHAAHAAIDAAYYAADSADAALAARAAERAASYAADAAFTDRAAERKVQLAELRNMWKDIQ